MVALNGTGKGMLWEEACADESLLPFVFLFLGSHNSIMSDLAFS